MHLYGWYSHTFLVFSVNENNTTAPPSSAIVNEAKVGNFMIACQPIFFLFEQATAMAS